MKKPIPFGKYILLERINVGGMAEVFLAKVAAHSGFDQLLAIKKILPTMMEDEEFITMFLDEARISVQLNHPNVVQIHELGRQDENFYIAMDYVAGKDLRTLVERYRRRKEIMPTAMAVFLGIKMAEGLDYAHKKKDAAGVDLNIVHRDVSPQNILMSYSGEVKIIDFGIAKAANRAQKTQAGILKGKFGYMSPEQVRGLPIDRRSDIFALGVVLFEMLTGEKLFVGESDFSTLEKVRNAEVPSPRGFNTNIPPTLEKVMYKALAREVEDRYQWGSELAEDLTRFLNAGETLYGAKQLSQFMGEAFAEDVMRERKRIEAFAALEPARPPPDDGPVSGSGPTARGVQRMTTPGKVPAVEPVPLPAARPASRTGGVPVMSSRGVMRAAPAPADAPVGRRSTGGGSPAIDPVAAALAELDGPTFQPGAMRVPAEFAQPAPAPVPKPRVAPKSAPAVGDPNNPYIPPPSAEEMAEMGTSDRTEIFKPAFSGGPVSLEAPQGLAPMARDVTDAGDSRDASAAGESNATMIGLSKDFAGPPPSDLDGETMMLNGHGAPAPAPNGKPRPVPSMGRMKAAPIAPPQAEPDLVETRAQNPHRVNGNANGFEPEVHEERTNQQPEPTAKRGRGTPARMDTDSSQEALSQETDTPPPDEQDGDAPEQTGDPESDSTNRMPPKPAGGSNARLIMIVVGTALAVVVLAVLGYFAVRWATAPPEGSVIITLDQANPDAVVRVDGQPAKLNEKVSMLVGPHLFELLIKGKVTLTKTIEVGKGIKPIQFNTLPAADEAPTPAPKPDDKKPADAAAAPTPPVAPAPPTEAPKAPDTPPPAVSKTYTLSVTSDPAGAEVIIGKSRKKTPATFTELDKAKTYPLKVVLKNYTPDPSTPTEMKWAEGDDPQKLAITLVAKPKPAPDDHPHPKPSHPPGDPVAATPKPPKNGPKGTLIISSKPLGKVYVDGKDMGVWTPVIPAHALSLVAGAHTVKIDDGAGHVAIKAVVIEAGQQARLLSVDLQ